VAEPHSKILEFEKVRSRPETGLAKQDIESILRGPEKPLASGLITGFLRLVELAVVAAPGIIIYLVMVRPADPDSYLRYISAVTIAVLISAALFQLSQVYSYDYIFARKLRFERVIMAWAMTGGLLARIRLSAFSQRTTRPIEGRVVSVSADRLINKNTGLPYYTAVVEMSEDPREVLDGAPLHPGMSAEVMLITGSGTALDYILAPVSRTFERAFREN